MISQMGSLNCAASLDPVSAVRLAGRAFTSAILTYFGSIVTDGAVLAKGSCGQCGAVVRENIRPPAASTISRVPRGGKIGRGARWQVRRKRIRMLPFARSDPD